ncbi:MAG: tRNA pseudouridine(38-40) synthase TruA [Pseudomonadota bacterium]
MPRFALKIEYKGAGYAGWQRQNDVATVQGTIEQALSQFDASAPTLAAAGRTDAGVHAFGQVAHCDLDKDWEPDRLKGALNYHLKDSRISVIETAQVDTDWHARFSAVERHYMFRLVSRRAPATHDAGLVWQIGHPLDVDAMRAGAAHLIGVHDFTTFRSVMCQSASPVKTLDEITLRSLDYPNGSELRVFLRARSFLHNQVRSIVGSLERVGAGSWDPDRIATALRAADRSACGPVCPPHGLYLANVIYPDDPFA